MWLIRMYWKHLLAIPAVVAGVAVRSHIDCLPDLRVTAVIHNATAHEERK
jgi:hypothetical protein